MPLVEETIYENRNAVREKKRIETEKLKFVIEIDMGFN